MNPFEVDYYTSESPHAEGIHESILQQLQTRVRRQGGSESRSNGDSALLLAPRAGYGKTHLLHELAKRMRGEAIIVPLRFSPELPLAWTRLCVDLIDSFHDTPLPGGETHASLLDQVARHFFGELVALAIERDLVRFSNHEQMDPETVRERSLELFDPEGGDFSRAEWLEENVEPLLAQLRRPLAKRLHLSTAAVDAWSECFFDHIFREEAWETWFQQLEVVEERDALARFREFSRIASRSDPLVFVVDHLQAFHCNVEAGHQIAYLLTQLEREVPHSLTILSVNQDVWESLFESGTPSALLDRLTRNTIHLSGLNREQARGLIAAYLPQGSDALWAGLQDTIPELASARQILRIARTAWDQQPLPEVQAGQNGHSESLPVVPEEPLSLRPEPSPSLGELYQELRLQHLDSGSPYPEVSKIRRLVAQAGAYFPFIDQQVLELSAETAGSAMVWHLPRRRVILGFPQTTSPHFWEELQRHCPVTEDFSKLVVLTPESGDFTWPDADSCMPMEPLFWDRELVASLHAADDLLLRSEAMALPYDQESVFRFLTQELDYFWKQLTRLPAQRSIS